MIKKWFRVYIYIYTKSLIFWVYKRKTCIYKFTWFRAELFYLLNPCIYIYIGFGDFQSLILFDNIRNSTVLNMFLNIFIKEGGINGIIGLLEYSICWFHVYMYRVLCNPHEILYRLYLNLQLVNSWFNVILLNFIIFIKS